MSASIALKMAILVPDYDLKETAVRYRQISCFTNVEPGSDRITTFEELPQSYFVAGGCIDTTKKIARAEFTSKALGLSYTATYDATTFLSNEYSRFRSQKKNKSTAETISRGAIVSTGQAALVLSRDNSSDSTFRAPQYHAVTFSFSQMTAGRFSETADAQDYHQLLMIRQPGLQRSGPMSLSKDLGSFEAFDIVEICTGMCLFSEQDLALCVHDGIILPTRLKDLPVSLSEMEIIVRLATTIANTSALYYHGCESNDRKVLRINIDIPFVQYYKDALDCHSSGKCTTSDVLDWMAAIKSRRRLLYFAFASAIRHGLNKRRVPDGSVVIVLSSGLKGADEGVFCALKFGHQTNGWIELMMQSLLTDSKELWGDFMNTLTQKDQQPNSWREFSTLSYMYEVIKPALRSRSTQSLQTKSDDTSIASDLGSNSAAKINASTPQSPKISCTMPTDFFDTGIKLGYVSNRRVLLLAIDDVDECRIYTKAYQSLCRLSTTSARSPGASLICPAPVTTRILTICPAPQVIVGTSGSDPKWMRPSLWRSSLRMEQNCDQLQFRNGKNLLDSDVQILKEVYDADLVAQVEGWVR